MNVTKQQLNAGLGTNFSTILHSRSANDLVSSELKDINSSIILHSRSANDLVSSEVKDIMMILP